MKIQINEKIYYVNINQKKAGVVLLITDKAEFKHGKLSGIRGTFGNDKMVHFPVRHKNL